MPTLCLDRARDHAKRIMADRSQHPAPWLAAAAQRWPGLTLATRLVREYRGTAVLLLSMLRLARRWWRRRPAA